MNQTFLASVPRAIVWMVGAVAAIGLGKLAWDGGNALWKVDAFASLRDRETAGLEDRVGVQLEGVRLRHYEKGKLVTKADIQTVKGSRDRGFLELENVTNGVIQGGARKVDFSAKHAIWDSRNKVLRAERGADVKTPEAQLSTPVIEFNRQTKEVVAPKPLKGTLLTGQAQTERLEMNLATGKFRTGAATWQGDLRRAKLIQEEVPGKTTWRINADSIDSVDEKAQTVTYKSADATDGEVLIKAPEVTVNRKTNVILAKGRVFYYSARANLMANTATIFRNERRAVMEGEVVMLVKPKDEEARKAGPKEEPLPPFKPMVPAEVKAAAPTAGNGPSEEEKALDRKLKSGETVREFPVVILAKKIDYFYARGKRRAEVEGEPQARQELPGSRWRQVWARHATYDGEAETLLLKGEAGKRETRMKNSLGEEFEAESFLLHTKEGDDRYSGKAIKGVMLADDEEEDPRRPAQTTQGNTTGGGGTGGGGGVP